MKMIYITLLVAALSCMTFAAADTSDYAQGLAALHKGDYQTAKVKLTSAYKKNSVSPFVQMAYASVAPCSTAVAIYKTIGETTTAPDSLRAEAYKLLGDYHYATGAFLKAIDNFRYATKYGTKPMYKHYWALAAFASGDTVSAKSLWHTLTLEHGDTIAEIANYQLGLVYTKQKAWTDAYNCFDKSGVPSASKPWAVAALNGKLECAKKLGQNDKVALLEKQLDPWRDLLLEKSTTPATGVSQATVAIQPSQSIKPQPADTAGEKPDSLKLFTLQIGAFSSKENASTLEQKLKTEFSDVSTQQFLIDDKIFYRVWVGSFKTKDKATAFGADSLTKKGFSFRVVEK